MNEATIAKALELKRQIKDIQNCLFYLKATWRMKITTKAPKIFLKNIAYGAFGEKTFECDAELRRKIIQLLEDHSKILEEEFEAL